MWKNMSFGFPLYHNPLKTRADLRRSLAELLEPLAAHAVPGGYHLGSAAALYPPAVARMEGWSRCLWGIGPLLAGGGAWPGLEDLRETLGRGVDPEDSAYWGDCGDRDQRLVEMAAIAFCLILAPKRFWEPLDEKTRANLYRWLSFIEKRELPPTNWHFFRLIVCAAFRKLGLPVDRGAEEESLALVESCYRGDGWYQDGEGGGFDLYNPMGFHFYGLVLTKLGVPSLAERSLERARLFGPSLGLWFHHDGSMIPYGRSLSYRFAGASFFSACAFAGLEVLPWGVMKGIVLRHLRRWFSLPILDAGGILSVGYGYPNLIMADAYNSPGSPYWGLKTYLVLALGEDHPFWRAEEQDLPPRNSPVTEKIPGFIISRSAADAQLLTAGRRPGFDMNHLAQKYCKFAYSARFGFCAAHSNYNIEKTGCDSALLLAEGSGGFRDPGLLWRERREAEDIEAADNLLRSRWRPWPDVEIVTILIRAGDWHVRLHRINSGRPLLSVEGGFSVPRLDDPGPAANAAKKDAEALVLFPWAASRIIGLDLSGPARRGALIAPAPNLNVLHPSVLIPVLEGPVERGISLLACAVWAGDPASEEEPPRLLAVRENSFTVFDGGGTKIAELSF
jgi:hypothetical protein